MGGKGRGRWGEGGEKRVREVGGEVGRGEGIEERVEEKEGWEEGEREEVVPRHLRYG